VILISLPQVVERPEDTAARITENWSREARISGLDPSKVQFRVLLTDYFGLENLSAGVPEGEVTAVVDKYPGFNSLMRADPRYARSILRDTRPGDLVISRVDNLVLPIRWNGPTLAALGTLPYLYHHQSRWQVAQLDASDFPQGSEGASATGPAGARLAARPQPAENIEARELLKRIDKLTSARAARRTRVDSYRIREAAEILRRALKERRPVKEEDLRPLANSIETVLVTWTYLRGHARVTLTQIRKELQDLIARVQPVQWTQPELFEPPDDGTAGARLAAPAFQVLQVQEWMGDDEIARRAAEERTRTGKGLQAPVTQGQTSVGLMEQALPVLTASASPGSYSFDGELTGARVLLVGPGLSGDEVIALIRRYPKIAELHVADLSREVFENLDGRLVLETASGALRKEALPRIIAHRTDVANLGGAMDGQVDLALDANVFDGGLFSPEYLGTTSQRLTSVLKPSGVHISMGWYRLKAHADPWTMQDLPLFTGGLRTFVNAWKKGGARLAVSPERPAVLKTRLHMRPVAFIQGQWSELFEETDLTIRYRLSQAPTDEWRDFTVLQSLLVPSQGLAPGSEIRVRAESPSLPPEALERIASFAADYLSVYEADDGGFPSDTASRSLRQLEDRLIADLASLGIRLYAEDEEGAAGARLAEYGPLELDENDRQAIAQLWRALDPGRRGEADYDAEVVSIQEPFKKFHPHDSQALEIGDEPFLYNFLEESFYPYSRVLSKNDYGEVMDGLRHVLDNLGTHGLNFGAVLMRVRVREGNRLSVLATVLDRGPGFVDARGRHVSIHRAVKAGRTYGPRGNAGYGLTRSVGIADRFQVVQVDGASGTSRAYEWQKGWWWERALKDTPPVPTGAQMLFIKFEVPYKSPGKPAAEGARLAVPSTTLRREQGRGLQAALRQPDSFSRLAVYLRHAHRSQIDYLLFRDSLNLVLLADPADWNRLVSKRRAIAEAGGPLAGLTEDVLSTYPNEPGEQPLVQPLIGHGSSPRTVLFDYLSSFYAARRLPLSMRSEMNAEEAEEAVTALLGRRDNRGILLRTLRRLTGDPELPVSMIRLPLRAHLIQEGRFQSVYMVIANLEDRRVVPFVLMLSKTGGSSSRAVEREYGELVRRRGQPGIVQVQAGTRFRTPSGRNVFAYTSEFLNDHDEVLYYHRSGPGNPSHTAFPLLYTEGRPAALYLNSILPWRRGFFSERRSAEILAGAVSLLVRFSDPGAGWMISRFNLGGGDANFFESFVPGMDGMSERSQAGDPSDPVRFSLIALRGRMATDVPRFISTLFSLHWLSRSVSEMAVIVEESGQRVLELEEGEGIPGWVVEGILAGLRRGLEEKFGPVEGPALARRWIREYLDALGSHPEMEVILREVTTGNERPLAERARLEAFIAEGPVAGGARLAVSDFSQRGGRLNATHLRLRDELLVPYLEAAGIVRADAEVVANTLVRSRQGLLDYYEGTGLLTETEAGLLAELSEVKTLDQGRPVLDRLESQSLRDDALALRVRALIDSYAAYPEGQRQTLVERLVPVGEVRGWIGSGVPEWVVFGALRNRFNLVRDFDAALRFVAAHEEATGGPAIAWQFLLFYGLEEGEAIFDRAAAWVASNQGVIGGSVNAWKFLLAHNLNTADRIMRQSRAWVRRHQARVGGPANAWQIVISYGLKGAGPFFTKARKWVSSNQALVGGPANAWRVVTRQGLSKADAFVAQARVWVEANRLTVRGRRNAWTILSSYGLDGADPFVADARAWVNDHQASVGGPRNAWDIAIKQGPGAASAWVESHQAGADLAVTGGASPARAWFLEITNLSVSGARLAVRDDEHLRELDIHPQFERLAREIGAVLSPEDAARVTAELRELLRHQSPFSFRNARALIHLVDVLFSPHVDGRLGDAILEFESTYGLVGDNLNTSRLAQGGEVLSFLFATELLTRGYEVSALSMKVSGDDGKAQPDALIRDPELGDVLLAEFKSTVQTSAGSFLSRDYAEQMKKYIRVVLTGDTSFFSGVYPEHVLETPPDGILYGVGDTLVQGKEAWSVEAQIQNWFERLVTEVRADLAREGVTTVRAIEPRLVVEFMPQPVLYARDASGTAPDRTPNERALDEVSWSRLRPILDRLLQEPSFRFVGAQRAEVYSYFMRTRGAAAVEAASEETVFNWYYALGPDVQSRTEVIRGARLAGEKEAAEYEKRMSGRYLSRPTVAQELLSRKEKLTNNPKFEPNLTTKSFYGLTTIAWVKDDGTPLLGQLVAVQARMREALEAAGYGNVFSWLEPASFHMTIADIDPGNKLWNENAEPFIEMPADLVSKRVEQVTRGFEEAGAPGPIHARVEGIGMKGVITGLVRFPVTEELLKVQRLESGIQTRTETKRRVFEGHISLGYFVNFPQDDADVEKIVGILRRFESEDLGEFVINDFDLTYFTDMNNFIPLATKDLVTGQVIRHEESIERFTAGARLSAPAPGTGPLDGAVIIRYADSYLSPGGVSTYLSDLNEGLLARSAVTVHQFYPVSGREKAVKTPGQTESMGRGTIVYHPIGTAAVSRAADNEGDGVVIRAAKAFLKFLVPFWLKSRVKLVLFGPRFLPLTARLPIVGGRARQILQSEETFRRTLDDLGPQLAGRRVIFVNHSPSNPLALLLDAEARRRGIPSMFTHHGGGEPMVDLAVMRRLALTARPSGVTLRRLGRTFRNAGTDLADGIDVVFFDPALADGAAARAKLGLDAGAFVALLPARVHPLKGHMDLIRAAGRLKREGRTVQVLFAGELRKDDFVEQALKLAEAEGVRGQVRFTGDLDREALRDVYAASDAVVLPSYTEGLPRVVLEGSAMERPVVATDAGGTADAVLDGRTGFVVRIGDRRALAARIGELAADPARRAAFGAEGRRHITAHYSIGRMLERHEAFYNGASAGARLAVLRVEPSVGGELETKEWRNRLVYLDRVRSVVNAENAPKIGFYVNAAANALDPFVAGNPDVLIMNDQFEFGPGLPDRSEGAAAFIRSLTAQPVLGENRIAALFGHLQVNLRELFMVSLERMAALQGAPITDLEIQSLGGDSWEIRFSWRHPSESAPRPRTVYFLGLRSSESLVAADLPVAVRDAIRSRGGLDLFFEKAPNYYKEFLDDDVDIYLRHRLHPDGLHGEREILSVNALKRAFLKPGAYLVGDNEQDSRFWLFLPKLLSPLYPSSNEWLEKDFPSEFRPVALGRRTILRLWLDQWGLKQDWGNGRLEIFRRVSGSPAAAVTGARLAGRKSDAPGDENPYRTPSIESYDPQPNRLKEFFRDNLLVFSAMSGIPFAAAAAAGLWRLNRDNIADYYLSERDLSSILFWGTSAYAVLTAWSIGSFVMLLVYVHLFFPEYEQEDDEPAETGSRIIKGIPPEDERDSGARLASGEEEREAHIARLAVEIAEPLSSDADLKAAVPAVRVLSDYLAARPEDVFSGMDALAVYTAFVEPPSLADQSLEEITQELQRALEKGDEPEVEASLIRLIDRLGLAAEDFELDEALFSTMVLALIHPAEKIRFAAVRALARLPANRRAQVLSLLRRMIEDPEVGSLMIYGIIRYFLESNREVATLSQLLRAPDRPELVVRQAAEAIARIAREGDRSLEATRELIAAVFDLGLEPALMEKLLRELARNAPVEAAAPVLAALMVYEDSEIGQLASDIFVNELSGRIDIQRGLEESETARRLRERQAQEKDAEDGARLAEVRNPVRFYELAESHLIAIRKDVSLEWNTAAVTNERTRALLERLNTLRGPIVASGDRGPLEAPFSHMVNELAKNALDSVHRSQEGMVPRPPGSAELHVYRAAGRVILDFSDDGVGIAQVIDEPGDFRVVPAYRDRTGRGALPPAYFGGGGVGFLWSKLLIEAHGGTFEVLRNAVPGYRTTIRVSLPEANVRPAVPADDTPKPYIPSTIPPPGMASNLGARLAAAPEVLLGTGETETLAAIAAQTDRATVRRLVTELIGRLNRRTRGMGRTAETQAWTEALSALNARYLIPQGLVAEVYPAGYFERMERFDEGRGFTLYEIVRTEERSTDTGPARVHFVRTAAGFEELGLLDNDGLSSFFDDYVLVAVDSAARRDVTQAAFARGLPPALGSLALELLDRAFAGTDAARRQAIREEGVVLHEIEHLRRKRILLGRIPPDVALGSFLARARGLVFAEEKLAELRSILDGEPFHILVHLLNRLEPGDVGDVAFALAGTADPGQLVDGLRRLIAGDPAVLRRTAQAAYDAAEQEWERALAGARLAQISENDVRATFGPFRTARTVQNIFNSLGSFDRGLAIDRDAAGRGQMAFTLNEEGKEFFWDLVKAVLWAQPGVDLSALNKDGRYKSQIADGAQVLTLEAPGTGGTKMNVPAGVLIVVMGTPVFFDITEATIGPEITADKLRELHRKAVEWAGQTSRRLHGAPPASVYNLRRLARVGPRWLNYEQAPPAQRDYSRFTVFNLTLADAADEPEMSLSPGHPASFDFQFLMVQLGNYDATLFTGQKVGVAGIGGGIAGLLAAKLGASAVYGTEIYRMYVDLAGWNARFVKDTGQIAETLPFEVQLRGDWPAAWDVNTLLSNTPGIGAEVDAPNPQSVTRKSGYEGKVPLATSFYMPASDFKVFFGVLKARVLARRGTSLILRIDADKDSGLTPRTAGLTDRDPDREAALRALDFLGEHPELSAQALNSVFYLIRPAGARLAVVEDVLAERIGALEKLIPSAEWSGGLPAYQVRLVSTELLRALDAAIDQRTTLSEETLRRLVGLLASLKHADIIPLLAGALTRLALDDARVRDLALEALRAAPDTPDIPSLPDRLVPRTRLRLAVLAAKTLVAADPQLNALSVLLEPAARTRFLSDAARLLDEGVPAERTAQVLRERYSERALLEPDAERLTVGTEWEVWAGDPPAFNPLEGRAVATMLGIPLGYGGAIEYSPSYSSNPDDQTAIYDFLSHYGLIPTRRALETFAEVPPRNRGGAYSYHLNFLIPTRTFDDSTAEAGKHLALLSAFLFTRTGRLRMGPQSLKIAAVRKKTAQAPLGDPAAAERHRLEVTLGNAITNDEWFFAGIYGDPLTSHIRLTDQAYRAYRMFNASLGTESPARERGQEAWGRFRAALRETAAELGVSLETFDDEASASHSLLDVIEREGWSTIVFWSHSTPEQWDFWRRIADAKEARSKVPGELVQRREDAERTELFAVQKRLDDKLQALFAEYPEFAPPAPLPPLSLTEPKGAPATKPAGARLAEPGAPRYPIIYSFDARLLKKRFSEITDAEILAIAKTGANLVYVSGLFRESDYSRELNEHWSKKEPYGDARVGDRRVASAFSIPAYEVAQTLGGEAEFRAFVVRARELAGLRVMADFVMNHMAADTPLLGTRPGLFVGVPSDVAAREGDNLNRDPANLWTPGFRPPGTDRAFYFGGGLSPDGRRMRWADTVQLDIARAETRRWIVEQALLVADLTDGGGIRFDAVAHLIRHRFKASWYPDMPDEEFDRLYPPDEEVLKVVAQALKARYPGIVLVAEYFGLEGDDVLNAGYDFFYEPFIRELLVDRKTDRLKEFLRELSPGEKFHFVKFLENNDMNGRIAKLLGHDPAMAAGALLYTLPGATLVLRGQEEGYDKWLPSAVFLDGPAESADPAIAEHYEWLAAATADPVFREGDFKMIEKDVPGPVVAFERSHEARSVAVVVNFSDQPASFTTQAASGAALEVALGPWETGLYGITGDRADPLPRQRGKDAPDGARLAEEKAVFATPGLEPIRASELSEREIVVPPYQEIYPSDWKKGLPDRIYEYGLPREYRFTAWELIFNGLLHAVSSENPRPEATVAFTLFRRAGSARPVLGLSIVQPEIGDADWQAIRRAAGRFREEGSLYLEDQSLRRQEGAIGGNGLKHLSDLMRLLPTTAEYTRGADGSLRTSLYVEVPASMGARLAVHFGPVDLDDLEGTIDTATARVIRDYPTQKEIDYRFAGTGVGYVRVIQGRPNEPAGAYVMRAILRAPGDHRAQQYMVTIQSGTIHINYARPGSDLSDLMDALGPGDGARLAQSPWFDQYKIPEEILGQRQLTTFHTPQEHLDSVFQFVDYFDGWIRANGLKLIVVDGDSGIGKSALTMTYHDNVADPAIVLQRDDYSYFFDEDSTARERLINDAVRYMNKGQVVIVEGFMMHSLDLMKEILKRAGPYPAGSVRILADVEQYGKNALLPQAPEGVQSLEYLKKYPHTSMDLLVYNNHLRSEIKIYAKSAGARLASGEQIDRIQKEVTWAYAVPLVKPTDPGLPEGRQEEVAQALRTRFEEGALTMAEIPGLLSGLAAGGVPIEDFLTDPLLKADVTSPDLQEGRWLPAHLKEHAFDPATETLGIQQARIIEVLQEIMREQGFTRPVFFLGSAAVESPGLPNDVDIGTSVALRNAHMAEYDAFFAEARRRMVRGDRPILGDKNHVGAVFGHMNLALGVSVRRYGRAYRVAPDTVHVIEARTGDTGARLAAEELSEDKFLGTARLPEEVQWTSLEEAFAADPDLRVLFTRAILARVIEREPIPIRTQDRAGSFERSGNVITLLDKDTLRPLERDGKSVNFEPTPEDIATARRAAESSAPLGRAQGSRPGAPAVTEESLTSLVGERSHSAGQVLDLLQGYLAENPVTDPLSLAKSVDAFPDDPARPDVFDAYARHYLVTLLEVSRLSVARGVVTFRFIGDKARVDRVLASDLGRRLLEEGVLRRERSVDAATGRPVREVRLAPVEGTEAGQPYLPETAPAAGELPQYKAYVLLALFAGRIDASGPPESFLNAYRTMLGEAGRGLDGPTVGRFLSGDVSAAALVLAARFALRPIKAIEWTRLLQFYQNIERMVSRAA